MHDQFCLNVKCGVMRRGSLKPVVTYTSPRVRLHFYASSRVLFVLALVGCCRTPEPQNADECILRHIPSAQTNGAAGLIARACHEQFPQKPEQDK